MNDLKYKYTAKGFLDFLNVNITSVIVSIFFLLLGYGLKLFSISFSIDTEAIISATQNQYDAWFTLGRIGLVVFKHLLGLGWYNNELASFLMVICFWVNSLLWGYLVYNLLGLKKNQVVFFILPFITSPIFAEMLGFLLTGLEIALALSLVAIGLMLIHNAFYYKNKYYYLLSIIVTFVAFNIYLVMITIFIIGVCFIMLIKLDKDSFFSKSNLHYFTINIIVFFISFVLYQVFDRIGLYILNLETSSYITEQFRWNKDTLDSILVTLLNNTKEIYFGDRIYYPIMFSIVSISLVIFIIYRVISKSVSIWIFLFVIPIFLSPMMMSVMLGTHSTERTIMTLPLSLGFITVYFMYKLSFSKVKTYSYILGLGFIITALNQGYIVNRIFYTEHIIYQQDTYLAYQIKQYIDELGFGEKPNYPVVYLGYHSAKCNNSCYKSNQLGLTGRSIFEITFGNEHGTFVKNHFMAAQGIYYTLPSNEQIRQATNSSSLLPNWPSKGSVALVNDVIVVKFN